MTQQAPILEALGTPKSQKVRKSDLQKNSWKTSSTQGRKSTENDSQKEVVFFNFWHYVASFFAPKLPKLQNQQKTQKKHEKYPPGI